MGSGASRPFASPQMDAGCSSSSAWARQAQGYDPRMRPGWRRVHVGLWDQVLAGPVFSNPLQTSAVLLKALATGGGGRYWRSCGARPRIRPHTSSHLQAQYPAALVQRRRQLVHAVLLRNQRNQDRAETRNQRGALGAEVVQHRSRAWFRGRQAVQQAQALAVQLGLGLAQQPTLVHQGLRGGQLACVSLSLSRQGDCTKGTNSANKDL